MGELAALARACGEAGVWPDEIRFELKRQPKKERRRIAEHVADAFKDERRRLAER